MLEDPKITLVNRTGLSYREHHLPFNPVEQTVEKPVRTSRFAYLIGKEVR